AHKKWRETSTGKHKEKPPVGTSFSFTVDQTASVTFTFSKAGSGRTVNGKCRASTSHNRKHPKCHLIQGEGTLTHTVGSGHHMIAFRGRVGQRKLPLGRYMVKLTATNSGNLHSRTATLKFTVVE